ncbi:MAG: hypothetical protein AAF711_18710 [Planctomycetota bacterium]
MRAEITWQANERLEVPRRDYPRIHRALIDTGHRSFQRAIRIFAIMLFIAVSLMLLGTIIATLQRPLIAGPPLLLLLFVLFILILAAKKTRSAFDMNLHVYKGQTHTY